jgi:hypothetical protein
MEKRELERISAERLVRAIVLVRGQRMLLGRDSGPITNCDRFEHQARAERKRVHRAGGRHALERSQERTGDCGQYRNHAGVRPAARDNVTAEGPRHQACRSGAQDCGT